MFDLDLENTTNRKDAERQLEEKIPEFGVRQFLLKNLSRKKEGGYAWKMNLEAIHEHYEDILANIEGDSVDVSTLFIKGGRSKYIQEENHKNIFDLFPNAEIKTIEDAGHWVHAEQPQLLMKQVLDFFE